MKVATNINCLTDQSAQFNPDQIHQSKPSKVNEAKSTVPVYLLTLELVLHVLVNLTHNSHLI